MGVEKCNIGLPRPSTVCTARKVALTLGTLGTVLSGKIRAPVLYHKEGSKREKAFVRGGSVACSTYLVYLLRGVGFI